MSEPRPATEAGSETRCPRQLPVTTRRLAIPVIVFVLAACSATAPASPQPLSTSAPAAATATSDPAPTAPSATGAAASAPAATPAATPVPAPGMTLPGVEWELRDVWMENPDGRAPSLEGALFIGSGFLAWGPTALGSAIVASSNGLAGWSQVGTDGQFDGMRIIGMAWAHAGIVALGADRAGIVRVWRSTDGVDWEAGPGRTGIGGTVGPLISTAGGTYLAAGTAKGGCDVAIWTSFDGFAWSPSEPLAGAHGACTAGAAAVVPAISLVTEGRAGLVAFGSVTGVGNATWTSADRIHWTFHPQPSIGGHVVGLTASSGGYVGVGNTGNGGAAAWTSPDGATWIPAPDQPSLHGTTMMEVHTLADGTLVAVGTDAAGVFTTWTSADGSTWTRGPAALYDGGWLPSGRVARLAVATDGGAATNQQETLIAAGGGSRIWVSPPITTGLQSVTLTIDVAGASFAGVGRCHGANAATNDIPAGGVDVLGRWVEPGDTGQSSPWATDGGGARRIDLTVGPDGRVLKFTYEDPVGRAFASGAANAAGVLLTAAPGSGPSTGSITFSGVAMMDPAIGAPDLGSRAISGSLTWTCGS